MIAAGNTMTQVMVQRRDGDVTPLSPGRGWPVSPACAGQACAGIPARVATARGQAPIATSWVKQ